MSKEESKIRRRCLSLAPFNVTLLLDKLTPTQLKNLSNHKYSSSGKSLLEPFYDPWWNFAITLCPMWIAPNMITFIGLLANLSSFVFMFSYCGLDGSGVAPSWVFYYAAFSLFFYQTMDAIDGKQARRTGTGSPLGELFDHGMDTIANCFFLPMIIMATNCAEEQEKAYFLSYLCFFVYYFSHSLQYITGTLTFGLIDITEIQTSTIGLLLMTGLMGQEHWAEASPIPGLSNRDTVVYGSACICFFALTRMFLLLSKGGCGPNGSSCAGTSILSPFPSILLIIGLGIVVGNKTGLAQQYPVAFIFYISMLCAKTGHKLVVAQLTKASLRLADPCLWSICLLGFNQYVGDLLPPNWLFAALSVYAIIDLARYCIRVYTQIAEFLKIRVLTIPKENQKLKSQ